MQTPTLNADGGLVLRPISSGDLPDLLESYKESPEDGQTALPWMYPRNVAEQLADFVRDIPPQRGGGPHPLLVDPNGRPARGNHRSW